jgi:hypothetical protein
LTITVSFHGTRVIGNIGVPATACNMRTRLSRSSGVCSMSTTAQSKPAQPSASATNGEAAMAKVPTG